MANTNDRFNWEDEDAYWRSNYGSRPYAASSGGRGYEYFQPGYRYGFDAANKHKNREWKDVESEVQKDWNSYEHRGESTWESMKQAVRDAWDRVTGKRSVGAH